MSMKNGLFFGACSPDTIYGILIALTGILLKVKIDLRDKINKAQNFEADSSAFGFDSGFIRYGIGIERVRRIKNWINNFPLFWIFLVIVIIGITRFVTQRFDPTIELFTICEYPISIDSLSIFCDIILLGIIFTISIYFAISYKSYTIFESEARDPFQMNWFS